MKALMIATEKLPVPPIRGGAIQTYIANVAFRLAESGIDLTVLGVSDPDLSNDEIRDGVRFVRAAGGTLARYQGAVVDFLGKERFDRIHLFNRPRLVLPVAEAAPDTPISLSLHNEMFLPPKIDTTEARQVIATVDRIATVSDFIGKGISEPYPEAGPKLRTIYSGVDAGEFVPGGTSEGRSMREALRQEHGLNDKHVVLFVGRLSPKKGADVLLRAMELVAKEVPSAALVMVGSKWYGADEMTDFVTYLKHLGARSSVPVVTTGFITPDQVNQWFAAGDLFVCPSVWQEPLARVHYEAMAAGLPIITTRRGGNPEVVEGTGVGLVIDDPENPEAMAKAIVDLLKNPSRREAMGQAGRRLAMERFNWDRVAQEIEALWAEAPPPDEGESAPDSRAAPSSTEARPEAKKAEQKGREAMRSKGKRAVATRPAESVTGTAGRTATPTREPNGTARRSTEKSRASGQTERSPATAKKMAELTTALKTMMSVKAAVQATKPASTMQGATEPVTAAEQTTESASTAERAIEPVTAAEQTTESASTVERAIEPVTAAEQTTESASTAERTTEPVTVAEKATEPTPTAETAKDATRGRRAAPSKRKAKDRRKIGKDLYQMGPSLWVSQRKQPLRKESRSDQTKRPK